MPRPGCSRHFRLTLRETDCYISFNRNRIVFEFSVIFYQCHVHLNPLLNFRAKKLPDVGAFLIMIMLLSSEYREVLQLGKQLSTNLQMFLHVSIIGRSVST